METALTHRNPKAGRPEQLSRTNYSVVGQSVPRVDGIRKATGQAIYADDLTLPRMLYGKLLGSRRPHARILSIDASKAKEIPGVKAVITGGDLPVKYGILPVSEDEYPLESRLKALNSTLYEEDTLSGGKLLSNMHRSGPNCSMQ